MYRDFDHELQTAIDTNRLEYFLAQLENIQQSHDIHLDLEELNSTCVRLFTCSPFLTWLIVLAGTADSHPHKPIFKVIP